MNPLPETVAVLTGDLVKSSRLPAAILQGLPAAMAGIARRAQEVFGTALVPAAIDVFRGDSWQWLVTDPARAVRLALFVRAALRSRFPDEDVDTRVAIGIGPVTSVPEDRISQGLGPAFEVSGRTLESMGRRGRLALARAGGPAGGFEAATLGLIDAIAAGWTAAQAKAVVGALAGQTQEQIGATWEPAINQATVTRHLDRASWSQIEAALAVFEDGHGSERPTCP